MACFSMLWTATRVALVFSMSFGVAVSQMGTIGTLAGTGDYGYSGDRGPASEARLDMAVSLATDPASDTIYVGDCSNHVVRRITSDGMITTIAGTGTAGFSGDNGTAVSARLNCPRGLAVDASGILYFSDSGNHRIRRIAANGAITTVAGTGIAGFTGDGGRADAARINGPRGIAIDPQRNLYFADSWNFRIRKVNPQGIITTVAGNGSYGVPGNAAAPLGAPLGFIHGIAVWQGDLFFTDVYNHRVLLLSPDGVIFRLSDAGFGSGGDGGSCSEAQFRFPRGIAATSSGELYVVDSGNHRIRWISRDFFITTVAGTGAAGFAGDGEPAAVAQFNKPYDVAILSSGALLISDLGNYRLRSANTSAPQPEVPEIGTQTAVTNAASKDHRVSAGARVAIDGRKLAQGSALANARDLPTSLGGTSVLIDGMPARLVAVSPSRIQAVLPEGLQPGMHDIRLMVARKSSQVIPFHVQDTAPGLFNDETRHAEAYHPDGSRNSQENPASRGARITFRATGLEGNVEDHELWLGGTKATVSGIRSAGSPGLWSIEAIIPQDVPAEGLIQAVLVWRGRHSNAVTLSVK